MTEHAQQPSPDDTPTLTDEQVEFLNSLFDLARQGRSEALLSAIDQGIPVDLTDHKGDTLLNLAVYNGQPELAAGLLERGADPNLANRRGQTALTCAVFVQDVETTRRLLEAGADPDAGAQSASATVTAFGLTSMGEILDAHRSDSA